MIAPYNLGAAANAGATLLADSFVVGSIVAFVACGLNLLFRRRGAAIRFGVLMAAVIATVCLPLLRLRLSDTSAGNGDSLLRFTGSWATWIIAVWATIATVSLLRVVFGLWTLRRLRRACSKANESLRSEILDAIVKYCPSRRVELLISPHATVPAAIGFFRPAVILPTWVLHEMSADEVNQIVTHELSHLRRYDDWTNLVQKVVRALLFFHPAIWWMESRMSLEREMACDDSVLMRTANARAYAECLARLAEKTYLRRGLAMAQAAVSRVRQTSRRVARILQSDSARTVSLGKAPVVLATLLVIGGLSIASRTPLLFSFGGNDGPVLAAVAKADVAIPGPRPIEAAWHEAGSAEAKPQVRSAAHKTAAVKRTVPLRPVLAGPDDESAASSVLIVVVQENDGVAVWRITTWHYSPKQQMPSARKT